MKALLTAYALAARLQELLQTSLTSFTTPNSVLGQIPMAAGAGTAHKIGLEAVPRLQSVGQTVSEDTPPVLATHSIPAAQAELAART
jgi:hypothetical protein